MAVNSLQKQPARGPGRPFEKGRSGNPAGRPRSARNKATLAAEALFDSETEALSRKAVELTLGGSEGTLRICLDRRSPFHHQINELLSSSSTPLPALCDISIGDKLWLLYP